ncbi:MAG: hypothetical protein ACRCX2_08210 [Paraclostridium sp.]
MKLNIGKNEHIQRNDRKYKTYNIRSERIKIMQFIISISRNGK